MRGLQRGDELDCLYNGVKEEDKADKNQVPKGHLNRSREHRGKLGSWRNKGVVQKGGSTPKDCLHFIAWLKEGTRNTIYVHAE